MEIEEGKRDERRKEPAELGWLVMVRRRRDDIHKLRESRAYLSSRGIKRWMDWLAGHDGWDRDQVGVYSTSERYVQPGTLARTGPLVDD